MQIYKRPLLGRNTVAYLVKQTDPGTPAYPTGADAFIAMEISGFVPAPRVIESPERVPDSFDLHTLLRAGFDSFDGQITAMVKPGTAGTVHGDGLLEALFGKRAYDGTSKQVTYSQYGPADTVDYWSLAFRLDKVGLWIFGARCTGGEFQFNAESDPRSFFSVSTNWIALQLAFAGPDSLAQALDNSGGASPQVFNQIVVNNARQFEVNARIKIGTDDNGGQGYQITAIDETTNTLTINPGITVDAGQTIPVGTAVEPFLPTPAVPQGDVLYTGLGWVKEGATQIPVVRANISYNAPLEVLHEKANSLYPTRLFESGVRSVEAELEMIFVEERTQYLKDRLDGKEWALEFEAGDPMADPAWAKLSIPKAVTMAVEHTWDEGAIRLTRRFRGIANAGNDVISLVVQTK